MDLLREIFSKVNVRPLLVTFLSLSMLLLATPEGSELLEDPLSWRLLSLVILVPLAHLLVYVWFVEVVGRLDSTLSEGDIASYGPMIGCGLLGCAVLVAFSYLRAHPVGPHSELLGKPGFIYFCTLFFLALETVQTRR